MGDGDDDEYIFHCQSIRDFILPHYYFIQPKLRLVLFVKIKRGFGLDEAVAPYRAEDTFCRILVLRSTVSSKIILLKALTQDLKEGCFF